MLSPCKLRIVFGGGTLHKVGPVMFSENHSESWPLLKKCKRTIDKCIQLGFLCTCVVFLLINVGGLVTRDLLFNSSYLEQLVS